MKLVTQEFEAPGDPERVAAVSALILGRTKTLRDKRVLDLACRTGSFSRALAANGAIVTGIEGKVENFSQIPETENAIFVQDDVRNLSPGKYGKFDITLCLGILYHLDADDACKLLCDIRAVTTDFAIIDTHIGAPEATVELGGVSYSGSWFDEGVPGPWSSIGNQRSFWFTAESLHDLVRSAGWADVEVISDTWWSGDPENRYRIVVS